MYLELGKKLHYAKETRVAVEDSLEEAGVPFSNPAWHGTEDAEGRLRDEMTKVEVAALSAGCDLERDLLELQD